jgi:hypothetical protein
MKKQMKKKKLNGIKADVKAMLPEFENQLEKEATLIGEAVADVIIIARLNDEETARKLIREQFVIINRQDVEGN